MNVAIKIKCEVSDQEVLDSILAVLHNTLPYMADNVEIFDLNQRDEDGFWVMPSHDAATSDVIPGYQLGQWPDGTKIRYPDGVKFVWRVASLRWEVLP